MLVDRRTICNGQSYEDLDGEGTSFCESNGPRSTSPPRLAMAVLNEEGGYVPAATDLATLLRSLPKTISKSTVVKARRVFLLNQHFATCRSGPAGYCGRSTKERSGITENGKTKSLSSLFFVVFLADVVVADSGPTRSLLHALGQ